MRVQKHRHRLRLCPEQALGQSVARVRPKCYVDQEVEPLGRGLVESACVELQVALKAEKVVARMVVHRPEQVLVHNPCLDQWDDKRAVADSHNSVGTATVADYRGARSFGPVVGKLAEHQSHRHPVVGVAVAIVMVTAGCQKDSAAPIACQKWVVRPGVVLASEPQAEQH